MDVRLGIDLGTSYFKLGLFDPLGNLLGVGRAAVPVRRSRDALRHELTVEDFWRTLQDALVEALIQAGRSADEICGVSYASQANSFLLLDANDRPLTPLVLWPDRRADTVDAAVEDLWHRPDFLRTTGLGIGADPVLAAAKLRWFQIRRPRLWRRCTRVATISDYLTFALTGRHVGDAGTAALLGLLDVQRSDWWDDALRAVGIEREQFSKPLRPGTPVGEVTADGAALIGLPTGAIFTVGGLDHHLGALGAGLGWGAEVSVSLGTVLACLRRSAEYRPTSGCITGPDTTPGGFYQLAFDANGAGVLEWYRRTHAPELCFAELDALAGEVPAGCDGLTALPGANDYPGRAGFRGIRASHGHGHFVRAIMESSADTLGQLIGRLCPAARPRRAVVTGGGAASTLWLRILGEATGIETVAADCDEPACRGAAGLA